MSKIIDGNNSQSLTFHPIHVLKLDLNSGKFAVSANKGYEDLDKQIVIPELGACITFIEVSIQEKTYTISTVTDGEVVTVFVLDNYCGKKSIFAEDKPVRLEVYKSILSETLRLLIGNLTAVYNKTHSLDVGEEINRLIPVYTAYSK